MNRSAGYTLIEVLIMLAVTAILAATVLETVRASTSNGVRIEQAARNASQDYITLAGVRRVVQATRADYSNEPGAFVGDETHFSALTSQALVNDRPGVQRYTLRLVNRAQGAALVYEDSAGSVQVQYWPDGEGRFAFFGEQAGHTVGFSRQVNSPRPRAWTQQWPPQDTSLQSYYTPLPLAIRAEISLNSGETLTTIFQLHASAGPTPRMEDLLGAITQ